MRSRSYSIPILFLLSAAILACLAGLVRHCKKFEVSAKVILKTEGISEITASSCRVAGTLLDVGSEGVYAHGFCWSRTANPAEALECSDLGPTNDRGSFTFLIEGLVPATKYYVWAYGDNADGRQYGNSLDFTTLSPLAPQVETGAVSNVTATSAQCDYDVVNDGGSPVNEHGVCWGTNPEPNIDGAHTTDGTGTGTFTSNMEGLSPDTEYRVRAFAINVAGIAYGVERTFSTLPAGDIPTVHTLDIADVTSTTAIVAGSISSDGGAEITAKGICWNVDPAPTVDNFMIVAGSGPAPYNCFLQELTPDTRYFVRAFAVNAAGVGYGEEMEFRTSPGPPS
jgi:hypothetical protein